LLGTSSALASARAPWSAADQARAVCADVLEADFPALCTLRGRGTSATATAALKHTAPQIHPRTTILMAFDSASRQFSHNPSADRHARRLPREALPGTESK
jgi:hypothetical protein